MKSTPTESAAQIADLQLQSLDTGTGFTFSAVGIDTLGASEFTLVVIARDCSSSIDRFTGELDKMGNEVVLACQKNPRADNLLFRATTFNSRIVEQGGFRPIINIPKDSFTGTLQAGGSTALCDAVVEAVDTCAAYAKDLANQDILCNAVIFVITDGEENASRNSPADVQKRIDKVKRSEELESITTVLVGLTDNGSLSAYLDQFKTDAGIDQFVDVGQASAQKLAKLADFVSRSISSTSQALGSGGPSVPIIAPAF